ncbi:interferon lambda-3-like [Gopherus flavomarginatus]|uniref:interferon lambda-3-like n=1 Tax=Gopherus flavomarginatus TaxID=286002 RepID=UPI0021CBC9C5|nr:interferon lambda-3-like [Gopherus flavomarginatus]
MLQGKMMGCKLLLVLTLWTMSTEAFRRGAPMKKCHLSKYKSLPPRELETFKNVKDRFEDIMLLSDRKCNTKIFHRNWEVKELSVHDRVILVKEELHLIIDVLENIRDPSLSELLGRPLEILKQIREDLKSCTRHQPDNHQRSGRLTSWLQKFHAAKKMETPGCLEASVVLNLFRLLNEDLKCAAYMESCT